MVSRHNRHNNSCVRRTNFKDGVYVRSDSQEMEYRAKYFHEKKILVSRDPPKRTFEHLGSQTWNFNNTNLIQIDNKI